MSLTDRSNAWRITLVLILVLVDGGVARGATPPKGKVYRCGNVFQDLPCPDAKVAEAHPVIAATTPRDPATCIAAAKAAGRTDTGDCTAKPPRESATATQTK